MTAHLFATRIIEDFKATVETHYLGKKILFKIVLVNDSAPGHMRTLMEM